MHRNILTEGERQASRQECKQSVSQAGSHACSQACIHTERARCPQTYMQTETYIEIQTETEVHRVRDRKT